MAREKVVIPDGFPRNLHEAMHRRGLTQTALGELSGIDQSQIGRYLSGKRQPLAESIVALARALGVTAESLLVVSAGPDITGPGFAVEAKHVVEVPAEIKAALDSYSWPTGTTTATVAEVSDALVKEAFQHRGSYIPQSHWHTRIGEELAARKGKRIAPPVVEDDDQPSPEMRAHKSATKKRRAS